jgi:phosphatidylglycerophosphate synthase
METADRPTLSTLKAQNYGRAEPPVYKVIRRLSVRLTFLCLPTRVTPNGITIAGLVLSLAAAGFVATGSVALARAGCVAMLAAYVLDCMDGELARARSQSSRLGIHLEHLGNWIVVGVLQIALSYGAWRQTGDTAYLIIGLLALFGWYGFYFLFLQLQHWTADLAEFSWLRRFSKLLLVLMPIDENLFILGAGIGRLDHAVAASTVSGVGLLSIALCLFLWPAFRLHRRGVW